MRDDLGDRMKLYEDVYNYKITNRLPVIIRIDGKAFHTWTRKTKCIKPFDEQLVELMANTTKFLCENIAGCVFGYCQSDEISLCLINSQTNQTQPWFDNRLQKIVSVSSSIATYYFNANNKFENKIPAFFDSRAFLIPCNEVINYFIWRQNDASRNSISSLAQSLYSHKELQNKNSDEKQEMCFQKGINWNDLPIAFKRGVFVYKKQSDEPLVNKMTKEITFRKKFIVDYNVEIFKYDANCILSKILTENGIEINKKVKTIEEIIGDK